MLSKQLCNSEKKTKKRHELIYRKLLAKSNEYS